MNDNDLFFISILFVFIGILIGVSFAIPIGKSYYKKGQIDYSCGVIKIYQATNTKWDVK